MTPGTDPDDDEGEYDGDEEQLKREQAEDAQKEKGMGCMSQKIKTLYRTTKCFYRYLHNIFNRKLSDAKNIRVVDKYWELLRDRAKAAEKNIDIDRSDLFKNGIPYKHLFEGKPNARGGISGYHIRAVFPQVIQEKVKSGSVVQASSWRVRIYDAVSKRFVFDTKSIFDISPRQLQDLFFDIIKDCNINDIQFKKQIITTISRVEGQQYILRIGYDGSMISLFPLIGA